LAAQPVDRYAGRAADVHRRDSWKRGVALTLPTLPRVLPNFVRHLLINLCVVVGCFAASACDGEGSGGVHIAAAPPPVATIATQREPTRTDALRVTVPDGLRDRFIEALRGQAGGPHPTVVSDGEPAAVRVVPVAGDDAQATVARRWAIVTASSRIELDSLTTEEFGHALATGAVYVAEEHQALVSALVAERGRPRAVLPGSLPDRLGAEHGSLAVVPADTVTVKLRALALDGIDPVRGEGDVTAYPLTTRVRFETTPGDPAAELLAVSLRQALEQVDRPPIRLTFTGDLIPARCVYDQMRRAGDWSAPFRATAARLSAAHLTIGSLDAAVSDEGTPIGCRETYNLLAPPQVVEGFRLAGFDVLTVATNHVKDCGSAGWCGDLAFNDTLANLRAAGIEPVGGGEDLEAARRPVIVTAGGMRFAFLGYDDIATYYHAGESTPGTAPLDFSTLAADVRAARAVADVVVVLPQWGEEYTVHPTERQREGAHIAIEAGATLVVGNHPHVVQAAKPVGDGYVAFALGNFVFDQDWSQETMEGLVVEATFSGPRLVAVRFLPVRIENRLRPVFLSAADGRAILTRVTDAAGRLGQQ
jgi:poly-gamma-glutamate capsule biosynthesis protein CapA/YwtB (metallophosphatase superfamily)